MPSASSLDFLILREPAHCCLHHRRVILQASDLRRIPQHMHDMQLSRLAVPRVCRGSQSSRPFVYLPTRHSANRSGPSQCLQADLHRDVRGRMHGGPRSPFHILGITDRTTLECTLKTQLAWLGYLRTALRIAVTRYMPMRWPALYCLLYYTALNSAIDLPRDPPLFPFCPTGSRSWTTFRNT